MGRPLADVSLASEATHQENDYLGSLRLESGTTLRWERRGRRVVVLSDLHLGQPAPHGFPRELEPALADVIRKAAAHRDILVLNGDILDRGNDRPRASAILASHP